MDPLALIGRNAELFQHDINEYQCDLTPKFIMSDGMLVQIIQAWVSV